MLRLNKVAQSRKPIIYPSNQFRFDDGRFTMNKLFAYVSKGATLLAVVATTLPNPGHSQTTPYPTPATVQQVLMEKMGDKAKDLTVTVEQGTVSLRGWAHGPREVHQARYLASKLPGVERAYSGGVRTWVASDPTPVF
jgi:hypothetical protein